MGVGTFGETVNGANKDMEGRESRRSRGVLWDLWPTTRPLLLLTVHHITNTTHTTLHPITIPTPHVTHHHPSNTPPPQQYLPTTLPSITLLHYNHDNLLFSFASNFQHLSTTTYASLHPNHTTHPILFHQQRHQKSTQYEFKWRKESSVNSNTASISLLNSL